MGGWDQGTFLCERECSQKGDYPLFSKLSRLFREHCDGEDFSVKAKKKREDKGFRQDLFRHCLES